MLICTKPLIRKANSNFFDCLGLGCCRFDTSLEALAQFLQLGRDRRDAIGISLPFARPIVLVIILGTPPLAHPLDRRHHAGMVGHISALDRGLSLALLLLVLRKDRRAILSPDVVALPVELGRVVNRKEDVEQIVIADLIGVERDPDGFGMASVTAADLLVSRILDRSADVGCYWWSNAR